jgi:hypothetical protein
MRKSVFTGSVLVVTEGLQAATRTAAAMHGVFREKFIVI